MGARSAAVADDQMAFGRPSNAKGKWVNRNADAVSIRVHYYQ
jgi:hypothetical protein